MVAVIRNTWCKDVEQKHLITKIVYGCKIGEENLQIANLFLDRFLNLSLLFFGGFLWVVVVIVVTATSTNQPIEWFVE